MASQDAFKRMDWSYPIDYTPRPSRTVDQSTGAPSLSEGSTQSISGHVIEKTEESEDRAEGGLEISGDIQFATDTELDIGGTVEVFHDDQKNTSTKYRVKDERHTHGFIQKLLGNHRFHYALTKIDRGESR